MILLDPEYEKGLAIILVSRWMNLRNMEWWKKGPKT